MSFGPTQPCPTLDAPVAAINAIHSSAAAAAGKPDDAGGLYPVIFLACGAQIMFTANLWKEVGLCNGTPGKVRHFIYKDDHAPPNLPIAVLVEFDNYYGPQFLDSAPNCVPIRVLYRGGGALGFPPPEILKFSMVFDQDCVRSNLRRSKNQKFSFWDMPPDHSRLLAR